MGHRKKRNANIELLRIISMLMIIYHHYAVHSGWDFPDYFSKRTVFINFIGSFGKIGVILFVLITGYFYSNMKFDLKKIFRLSNITRFYSIIILLVVLFLNDPNLKVSLQDLINSLFPISFSIYWFITVYIVILLLTPIIKPFLLTVKRKEKLKYTLLLILTVHIPSFIGIVTQTSNYYYPSRVLAFVYIILIGDLIKCYEKELTNKYFRYIPLFFIFSLFVIIYRSIIYQPYLVNILPKTPEWFLIGTESINALIFCFTTFILIKKMEIKNTKLILFLSPVVLDVYLIHDNYYMRTLIWKYLFNNKTFFYTSLFLRTLFEPLLVFSICILIALFRIKIFKTLAWYMSTVFSILKKRFGSLSQ